MKIKTIHNLDLSNKKILVRADLNVPIKNGKVADTTRIQELKETIDFLLSKNAKVAICSHLGRPDGNPNPEYSLQQIQSTLAQILNVEVIFTEDCISSEIPTLLNSLASNQVLLLENTRFYVDEEDNNSEFAKKLSAPFDIFINDAFGTAHRAHASTEGVTHFLPSYAGLLIEKEITIMGPLLNKSQIEKPLTVIISGAKIDTKIGIIKKFIGLADNIIVGGALANTFLLATNNPVGKSLVQEDKIGLALETLELASNNGTKIILPEDAVVATEITENAQTQNKLISEINDDEMILDIGTNTIKHFSQIIQESKTIIVNGPMGIYELTPFAKGTEMILNQIANSNANSIIGGGDTIDAITKFQIPTNKFNHISTGGGAMIEFLEGQTLPGITPLLED